MVSGIEYLHRLSVAPFKEDPLKLLRGIYRIMKNRLAPARGIANHQLPQTIDLSVQEVNEQYLASKVRELAFSRIYRKPPILSSDDIRTISPSIDQAIRNAIQNGKISDIRLYANWGGYYVMFEGIYPVGDSYSVRVFHSLPKSPRIRVT